MTQKTSASSKRSPSQSAPPAKRSLRSGAQAPTAAVCLPVSALASLEALLERQASAGVPAHTSLALAAPAAAEHTYQGPAAPWEGIQPDEALPHHLASLRLEEKQEPDNL